jgi:peroxiredoxin
MRVIRARGSMLVGLLVGACGGSTPATVAVAPPPPAPIVVAPPPPPEPAVVATPTEPAEASEQIEAAPPEASTPVESRRGWLGVELEPAPDLGGVRINNIVPRSPAEGAGLIVGDVILKIDGDAVPTASSVVAAVQRRKPGAQVGIVLKRGRTDKLVSLQLGAAPEADELARMTFVDHPAPSFLDLRAARGTFSPTLAAQRGQVVVLEFWATWCTACRLLIPHMNDWHAQYAARGLRVIGITVEPVTRAAAAATELGMDYNIASDETGKTTTAYKARAIPAVFAIDRSGNVRDVMIGFDAARLAKFDQLVKRLVAER